MRAFIVCSLAGVLACGGGPGSDLPPEIQAEVELVVGDADEGPASFADVRGMAVDRSGRLYVLDTKDAQVRVFDSLGHFVRIVGRSGQGPGELSQPNGLALDAQDRLHVYDPGNRRLTVFDTSGAVESVVPVRISSWGYIWGGGLDSTGRLYDVQSTPSDEGSHRFVRRLDWVAGKEDSFPLPDCGIPVAGYYQFARGSMGVPHSSGRYTMVDPWGEGSVWCAHTGEARAWRVPLGATVPVDSVFSDVEPAALTRADRDTVVARIERFQKMVGEGDVDLSRIPDTRPVLLGLVRSREGMIWMHVEDAAGPSLHRMGADGRVRDRVRLPIAPNQYIPMVVQGDRIWAFALDSLGVPVVVRMRAGEGK